MRRFIFLTFLFLGCSYAQKELKIDENKLIEFIKKNFKNYQIFDKPIIKAKYKNLILVEFASAGATTNYSVILLYKNNNFQITKIKKDSKYENAIFVIGVGGAGRYGADVKLGEKLKFYEYSIYGEDNDYCRANVYNFNNKAFILDEKESKIERENYCKEVCKMLGIESKACD
ncbi:MAG: hypothetical protein ABIL89_00010 [candidate division WOR-3 bacterium]